MKIFSKDETAKIKGIAILLLLFHHLFYNLDHVEKSQMQFLFFDPADIQPFAIAARICVWVFVFLSAYGLTCSYMSSMSNKKGKLQFIILKWLSLMKTYWFVFIIVLLLFSLTIRNPYPYYENSAPRLILDFLGWSDFFGTPMLSAVWWYMCLAQILVVLIPAAFVLCDKLGWSSYIVVFLVLQYLPEGISSQYGGKYSNYFLVIILAVLCAKKQVFNRILQKSTSKSKNLLEFIVAFGMIILLLYFKLKFTDMDKWQLNSVISSIAAFLICYVGSKYCTGKFITFILKFLGKHSGNIFMFHASVYTFWPQLVYWSKNAIISYLTLLIISILFSIVIEYIKKVIHYNELFSHISTALSERSELH